MHSGVCPVECPQELGQNLGLAVADGLEASSSTLADESSRISKGPGQDATTRRALPVRQDESAESPCTLLFRSQERGQPG